MTTPTPLPDLPDDAAMALGLVANGEAWWRWVRREKEERDDDK